MLSKLNEEQIKALNEYGYNFNSYEDIIFYLLPIAARAKDYTQGTKAAIDCEIITEIIASLYQGL